MIPGCVYIIAIFPHRRRSRCRQCRFRCRRRLLSRRSASPAASLPYALAQWIPRWSSKGRGAPGQSSPPFDCPTPPPKTRAAPAESHIASTPSTSRLNPGQSWLTSAYEQQQQHRDRLLSTYPRRSLRFQRAASSSSSRYACKPSPSLSPHVQTSVSNKPSTPMQDGSQGGIR